MAHADIISCRGSSFEATARRLLLERAKRTLLYRDDGRTLTDMLGGIDCVFSDIDGTLTAEGAAALPPRVVRYMRRLHAAGITVVLVSGKPYEEAAPLIQALPHELQVRAIYEKGAYELEANTSGQLSPAYLLGSRELEREAMLLRRHLVAFWNRTAAAYASQHVSFGWAGTGGHRSLLSFDVYAGRVPADYQRLIGRERDRLKLKDPAILFAVETELRAFVDSHCPEWDVTHLGNANFEIAPRSIEKDAAILGTPEFRNAQRVLVLGDSGNDQRMMTLRGNSKIAAGLILHNPAAIALAGVVDFVTFGLANPYPLLDRLLEAASPTR